MERVTAFKVYDKGDELLGVVDATLPSVEAMSETVKGAGLAGEIDTPSVGLFGSMTLALNWRTAEKQAAKLNEPKTQELTLRGSIQDFDKATGEYRHVPYKVYVKGQPKKLEGGKFEPGASMDVPQEFEVIYVKKELDGVETLELDKYNYIYRVNGVDYLADIRTNLGM
ncbi:phage major tail tube protein [Limisalsivibrio acetivorans]|uniref:phage major tail tube protein n=1 Tax=Limisalsivibrio acetivorans TaxID=1304888 RepID=UPI0003B3CD3D|nr:phage major tail tube protein [Limisalsivibrio acetivorans]